MVVLGHAPAAGTGYVYDDREAILRNEDLQSFGGLRAVLTTNYWGPRNIGLYRPLVQVSYLLEGATVGFIPAVSHLVNLLLHLCAVLLLHAFLLRLQVPSGAALAGAALFGVHPALLDAAVWISGRTDVLAALFVLAGLLAGLRAGARGEGPLGRSTLFLGACYLLGLLSKEMAGTLPLLLLLLQGRKAWARMPVLAHALVAYLLLRLLAVEGFVPAGAGPEGVVLEDRSLLERLCVGAAAMVRLLLLLPLPVGLAADHRADPLAAPEAPAGMLAVGALVLLAGLLAGGIVARRRRHATGFLLAAIPVSLLPVLQVVPIGAVMAERFLYLPAAFLLPLLVLVVRAALPAGGTLRVAVGCAAVLAAGVVTWARIPVYENDGAYFKDVVRAYPQDERAWNNLGVYLADRARPPEPRQAERALRRALHIRPGYRKAAFNLGALYLDHDLEAARGFLEPRAGHDPALLYLLGRVDLEQARREPDRASGLLPRAEQRLEEAAAALETRGRTARAARAWRSAAAAADLLGHEARARRHLERSAALRR